MSSSLHSLTVLSAQHVADQTSSDSYNVKPGHVTIAPCKVVPRATIITESTHGMQDSARGFWVIAA